jgi:hypothetical protein
MVPFFKEKNPLVVISALDVSLSRGAVVLIIPSVGT